MKQIAIIAAAGSLAAIAVPASAADIAPAHAVTPTPVSITETIAAFGAIDRFGRRTHDPPPQPRRYGDVATRMTITGMMTTGTIAVDIAVATAGSMTTTDATMNPAAFGAVTASGGGVMGAIIAAETMGPPAL